MPTTVVKRIDPTGAGDYPNFAAWVAARKGDLPSRDTIEVAEVYGGGSAGELRLDTADWTTDADHYIHVRAAAGHEHPGILDTSKAYIQGVTDNPVIIRVGWTRFGPGISVYSDVDSPGVIGPPHCVLVMDISQNAPCLVEGIVAKVSGGVCFRAEYSNPAAYHVFKNCVALKGASGATGYAVLNASMIVHGCDAIVGDLALWAHNDGGEGGPPANPGTMISENNYLSGGTIYSATGTGSSIAHGAKDATSNGEATDPTLRNIPYSNANFLNAFSQAAGGVERSWEDAHLTAASPLRGKGVDLRTSSYPYAAVTVDLDQHARPAAPDVGALQFTVPTTIVKSVGPGGDYATWAAWLADRKGNLAIRDTIEVVEIRAGTGGIVGARLDPGAWGTNLKNYVQVRAAPLHGHRGKFDATKAYFKNDATTRDALFVGVGNTRIGPGLCLENSFFTGAGQDPRCLQIDSIVRAGPILVEEVLMKNTAILENTHIVRAENSAYDPSRPHVIRNCEDHCAGGNTSLRGFRLHGEWKVHNCTIIAFGSSAEALVASGGTVTSENNYIAGTFKSYNVEGGGTMVQGQKDATANAEALDPALRNIAANDYAVFLDPLPAGYPTTDPDFHLIPTSILVGKGADLTSQGVTRDFDGKDRLAPFDVGADEQLQLVRLEAALDVTADLLAAISLAIGFRPGLEEFWDVPEGGNPWNVPQAGIEEATGGGIRTSREVLRKTAAEITYRDLEIATEEFEEGEEIVSVATSVSPLGLVVESRATAGSVVQFLLSGGAEGTTYTLTATVTTTRGQRLQGCARIKVKAC